MLSGPTLFTAFSSSLVDGGRLLAFAYTAFTAEATPEGGRYEPVRPLILQNAGQLHNIPSLLAEPPPPRAGSAARDQRLNHTHC